MKLSIFLSLTLSFSFALCQDIRYSLLQTLLLPHLLAILCLHNFISRDRERERKGTPVLLLLFLCFIHKLHTLFPSRLHVERVSSMFALGASSWNIKLQKTCANKPYTQPSSHLPAFCLETYTVDLSTYIFCF